MRKRDEEEVIAKVVHHDANGHTLEVNDEIRITSPHGVETARILQDHGEPLVVKRGSGYYPLEYLLSKKSLKIEKV